MENLKFNELGLSPEILKALHEMGFEEATPIQSQAIPPILSGRDVLGQAQTGTGKTCAFGIPSIERLTGERCVQVLILCPTRELAIQVSDEIKKTAKYKHGVKVLPIYGGQSIDRQILALKARPQIIVGTPGRVMDHMRRRTLRLSGLTIVILDEADEMLNMGFKEDIDTILQEVPQKRQTLLFSATIPPEIQEITESYQTDPVHIKTVHRELSVPQIEQYYVEVREGSRLDILCRFIDAKNIRLGLIFCNTKRRVDELTEGLQNRGYPVDALHGDMKQSERDRVMNRFRKGQIDFLVATDVAARGIDVNDIEAVFNYDIPNDEEYYVHRIGRTGRAGKSGAAYSFIFGREIYKLRDIQRYTKSTIKQVKPPTLADVEGTLLASTTERIKKVVEAGHYTRYVSRIETVLEEVNQGSDENITSLDIAAALFQMLFGENSRDYGDADLDAEFSRSGQMARLFVNAGSMDKIQPGNLVQGIASKTSLPGKAIGSIDIHKNFTFVEVPIEYADEVVEAMMNFTHRGRKVSFEKAAKRQRYRPGEKAKSSPGRSQTRPRTKYGAKRDKS